MSSAWTPELDLLAACCRWPRSADRDAVIRRKAAEAIDWDQFERTVRRHRAPVLAAEGLQRAGLPVSPDLAAYAASSAADALRLAREAIRLQRAFDGAGISAMFVKGSTLALLAYGDLGKKHSADIDLVTTAQEAVDARRLLQQLGYDLFHPALNERQFARYASFDKECTFRHAELGVAIDLHWRLSDNRRLLAGVDRDAPTQEVRLGTSSLRTLADEPLFAYLCVHGTMHGWARLKWLADVAAFLGTRSEAEVSRLHGAAVGLGAGRASGVALVLCHRILGLPVGPDLLQHLDEDRAVGRLVGIALRCLTFGDGTVELGRYSPTGLRLSLSRFSVGEGAGYARSEFDRMLTSGWDRARLELPRPLGFLYYAIRVPSFVARLVMRRFADR